MPPRENSKAAAAKARKAEAAEAKNKQKNAEKEREEDAKWAKGAKSNKSKEDKAAKAAAEKERKAEAARLLAAEEAALPSKPAKANPKAGAKKAAAKPLFKVSGTSANEGPESFSASGIDDALEMLSLATEKTDKATLGSKAGQLESHPERKFKAAFEAYKEDELPRIRKEYPGLRLQQYHDRLYKEFQKSPLNPFNQVTVAYNATKEEKVAVLQDIKAQAERRYKD